MSTVESVGTEMLTCFARPQECRYGIMCDLFGFYFTSLLAAGLFTRSNFR